MAQVGIVCDSTCDLPLTWYAQNGVRMVPLTVFFGEQGYRDWVEMQPEEFYRRLAAAAALPTTSQPSPADFAKAYAELAEQGCEGIVSIHLTSKLSGTFESATMAAAESSIPVHVVDTRRVTAGTALVVKAAVAARDAGASIEEVLATAVDVSSKMRLFFILDTLDYLVKGGRAGKAQGLAASLLNIKPVLTFNDEGTIEPFKKVKGTRKSLTELAEQVAQDSRGAGRMRVGILQAQAPDLADQLVAALDSAGADYELDSIEQVGACIGTYSGPRAVGAAYYPVG